jgi:integrase
MEELSMGSIRSRPETGALFMDFKFQGQRLREQTTLADNPANRKRLQKALDRIETEIALGTFDYEKTFGKPLQQRDAKDVHANAELSSTAMAVQTALSLTPNFREFANQWFGETEVTWRRSYKITQRGALDKYILPNFGDKSIGMVTKADVLAFRAELSKLKGRGKNVSLTARRINAIMKPLRQILNEAADRYNFNSPFRNIKPLRMKRSEVMPFTMAEVQLLITSVRQDFQSYFKTRIFTGMRTGEVNGLKWKYVDFERRLIYVRESIVLGEEDELKTDGSMRDIQMSQIVFDALKAQFEVTGKLSDYVFCNRAGNPIDNKNFINRVWSPLLRHLGLEHRKAYQMRHTAATLWLASGEAPEWIARQLGHTTTEMLFRVYSRYVPNLTRNDGSAMDRLLTSTFIATPVSPAQAAPQDIPPPKVVVPNEVPTAAVSNAREVRVVPSSTSGTGANRDAQAPPIRWADMAKSWMSNDSSYESAA